MSYNNEQDGKIYPHMYHSGMDAGGVCIIYFSVGVINNMTKAAYKKNIYFGLRLQRV